VELKVPHEPTGSLSIHDAVKESTVGVVKMLLEVDLQSRYGTNNNGLNLLHFAAFDSRKKIGTAKVKYLCDHCPDLLKKFDYLGVTPLECQKFIRMFN
jgi:ankyrin repeat protein